MKQVLIAFDGTDSREWRRTDRGAEGYGLNSHISRFWQDFKTENRFKKYYEGPSTAGGEADSVVNHAVRWLINSGVFRELSQDETKICVVGHSRGCLSAIRFASELSLGYGILRHHLRSQTQTGWRLPIAIDFMGLYDAVERDFLSSSTNLIELRHTANIYHAMRFNTSWDGSRWSFGRMDFPHQQSRLTARWFDTSHGGIGGDPGIFTPFGATNDNYCSALTLIMNMYELSQYGGVRVADLNAPQYRPITDPNERRDRATKIQGFIHNSGRADRFIRDGAVRAGILFNGESLHIPYDNGNERWWLRLQQVIENPAQPIP